MKTLTLLRHAKTEPDSPDGDFGRSLTERGRADADRMSREIRDLGLQFDLVLASPARRVVETLSALIALAPQFDRRVYNASPGQLLDIVGGVDDGVGRLLLVGHNPGLERLASLLIAGGPEDFPTGALAEIALPIEHWRDLAEHKGRLVRFIRPKELA